MFKKYSAVAREKSVRWRLLPKAFPAKTIPPQFTEIYALPIPVSFF